ARRARGLAAVGAQGGGAARPAGEDLVAGVEAGAAIGRVHDVRAGGVTRRRTARGLRRERSALAANLSGAVGALVAALRAARVADAIAAELARAGVALGRGLAGLGAGHQ